MPQEWLPFIKQYGATVVGLVIVSLILYRHNKASFDFLLKLIGDMTVRIRTLEGEQAKLLIETVQKCELTIARNSELAGREIEVLGRTEQVLDKSSTKLEEAAKLIERLKRSKSLPPENS